MKNFFRNGLAIFVATLFLASTSKMVQPSAPKLAQDTLHIDHDYVLEATMLGYFAKDGTRNPTLKANKGKRVRITIYNGEVMTHDIALEKAGIKTPSISDKGAKVSMTFIAKENDIYFCTVPGHRAAGMVGKLEIVTGETATIASTGVIPTKNGKSMNVNFETGTLENWKATGEAFLNPLISQNSSPLHDKAVKINPEGTYFLSSGGTVNYALKGTLTSESFKITHPFASFLVSGGAIQDTRVELVLAKSQQVIFKSTGQGRATLQPVVANLKAHLGQEMFIRIIDHETGISPIPYVGHDKLAHINFDNFRFHATRPTFPNELNQKDIIVLPPLDPILHAGLSGKEAAKVMTLPKGFKITLAASEPDIVRPISFTMDSRGRLWVVEGHTYPIPAPEGQGKDRILIFEDTDGDGTLDKRKVFMEGLNLVSGIEVGMGGVWLGAAPYLLFIPTDFTLDKPTGPIQKLLDGWGVQDTHEVLNSLRWGPDGWLYGTHGVFTHSNVGKPGATDQERTKINAGVWRFHPKTHVFEVFAEGSSNPWGIDFNEYGHPFITVCVIPHMFHIIQGARYQRQGGKHFNPYTYDDIKTIADHAHYVGDRGPHAGNFRSASAGGGHAHAGAMIYLGGNTWPKEFRNNIFMNNINGAKLNVDILTPKGSGYSASHKKDFLSMNDSWSQWLNMKYDPSGSVYAIDWYDKNQCHSTNPDVHDKTMGRIFKITHEADVFVRVDLSKSTDLELVNHQLNPNEWYVRQSRTILQERGGNAQVYKALRDILDKNPDVTRKLRALWTLQVTGGLMEMDLERLLGHESPHVRSWAIQLATEKKVVSATFLSKLESIAKTEFSAQVRLAMLSGLMRLRPEMRWNVVEALAQKSEDRLDHNIPLMVWYAAEPLAAIDPVRSLAMAEKAKMPKFLLYMVQRIGAIKSAESKKVLEGFMDRLGNNHEQHEIMMAVEKALKENK